MPLQLVSLEKEIETALHTLQSDPTDLSSISQDEELRFYLSSELMSARKESKSSYTERLGLDAMTEEEKESLLLREIEDSCRQLNLEIDYFRQRIRECNEEKQLLSQTNSDLNEVRMELERHSEHNSRLINSLNDNEASIFDNEMENYRSDYIRLQKANRILINEIKDLLNTCYGNRTSSGDPTTLLSKEILSLLEECIKKTLDREASDKYVTLSPQMVAGEATQLLLSSNIIQIDPRNSNRVKIVDFYRYQFLFAYRLLCLNLAQIPIFSRVTTTC